MTAPTRQVEYRRVCVDELGEWLSRGWQLVPGAESYNGDRWAVLIWRVEVAPPVAEGGGS